jgi:glutathione S-transferase
MTEPRFLLHHAPRSRSGRILWLLEEAGVPYDLVWHALDQGTQKTPDYLLKNPFGKVRRWRTAAPRAPGPR